MRLFHGSILKILEIDLSKSRLDKDFGKGFYLSDNEEQALKMAKIKSRLFGMPPVVSQFEFNEIALSDGSLNVLRFNGYSKEWAEFIFANRKSSQTGFTHDYDLVIGPIANDKIGVQVRLFEDDEIDLDTFLERIKYIKGITVQYYFGTEKAIKTLTTL